MVVDLITPDLLGADT